MKAEKQNVRKYYKYDVDNPVYNIAKVGSITNNNGILSGFSASNYAQLPNSFVHNSQPWEIQFKVTTGSNVNTQGCICEQLFNGSKYTGLTLYIQSGTFRMRGGNGSSNIVDIDSSYSIKANTTYWFKAEFTGSKYNFYASTDGTSWTQVTSVSSNSILTDNYSMNIGRRNYSAGSYPWLGEIDLNESYIKVNGEYFWQGVTEPIIDGSETDYDFYKDVDVYKVIKDSNKYYAVNER